MLALILVPFRPDPLSAGFAAEAFGEEHALFLQLLNKEGLDRVMLHVGSAGIDELARHAEFLAMLLQLHAVVRGMRRIFLLLSEARHCFIVEVDDRAG